MPKCGARTRNGGRCQKYPISGKNRCALHGGKSTGPNVPAKQSGNQNARTHGIYSDAITEDERGLWEQIEIGNLDNAIKVAHLQLRRAMIAQAKAEADDGLDLDAVIDTGGEDHNSLSTQRRRRPYEDIINRLLGRIGDLEAKRADILNKAGHADDMSGLLSDLLEKLPS